LAQTLALFSGGQVKVLVYNEQTGGPQTDSVLAAAKAANVPVVPVTETLPADTSYLDWMSGNLSALKSALSQ
ncbi:MAG: zinc/manganese transport system substrate-binding protein, partial [Subtercola sp.]|nr:zinc/manganese transport system substrate-binding protein [Subtercola sp.]